MNIKNILKNNISDNNYISKNIIKPCRDWFFLLTFLIIAIIFSVFFDIFTYQKIIKGEMYISVGKEELILVKLEKEKLKNITDSFEQKKEYISKARIDNVVDPSI